MDETERRIRQARPLSGNRYQPLTPRAERELATLLADDASEPAASADQELSLTSDCRSGRTEKRRRPVLLTLSLAAVMILGLVVVMQIVPGQSPSAHAATPPLLEINPLDDEANETFAVLSETAANRDPDSDPSGSTFIALESWNLSVTIGEDGQTEVQEVLPERHEVLFREDGSADVLIIAGEPFTDDFQPEDEVAEGEVLVHETTAPGEYARAYTDPVPTDSDQILDYLMAPYPEEEEPFDAGRVFSETTGLYNEQQLNGEQEAALLEYLATMPGVEVTGETTDRLGRAGIVFTASSAEDPDHQHSLIVSPEGHILASETLYVGDSRPYLEAPAVVEYFAWERSH